MKRFLIFMLITLAVQVSLAQSVDFPATEYTQDPKANFRLYKTKNMYNFIKLDTRTGQMEMVQWSLDGKSGTYTLSDLELVTSAQDKIPGRFTLYSTTNIYQFVLLDQVDGRTWHVQWGFEDSKRWIERIY